MSTQTITKKRKSTDGSTSVTKKVKTAKSADKPAPEKSALKKTKTVTQISEEPKPVKSAVKKSKPTTKTAEEAAPVESTAKKSRSKAKKADAPVESAVTEAVEEESIPEAAKPVKSATKKTKAANKTTDEVAPVESAPKKTKSKAKKPDAPEASKAAEDVEEESIVPDSATNTELTPDQTAALLAGFSSDEDEASDDESGIVLSSLPKAPTTGAVQKRINEAMKSQSKNSDGTEDPERTPGVIYIGRLPHGFFEHQLRAYFSQFGNIINLRLMRNKKTGASQHYGFIEFASAAVADIVCKTMDKYLLFNHILQVRRVPREQVNENMWRKSSRRARNPAPRNRLEGTNLRRGATREVWEARIVKEEKKRAEKAEKLKEMGYEFEMPLLKSVGDVPVKPKAIEGGVAVDSADAEAGAVVESATIVQEGPNTTVEQTVSKKRPASGKTQVKKAVKKVKA